MTVLLTASVAVRVLEPAVGTPIKTQPVLVRGTIAPPDPTVVVFVNHRPALMAQDGQWGLLLDLKPGAHVLRANARLGDRVVGTTEHRVVVEGPAHDLWPLWVMGISWYLDRRKIAVGTAPFRWVFSLDPAAGVPEAELLPEGPGGPTVALRKGVQVEHVFAAPGFYTPTLRYLDETGRSFTQQTLAVVYEPAWLEPILQARWKAFQSAMAVGNIPGALEHVHIAKQKAFELVTRWGPLGHLWAGLAGQPIRLERVNLLAALCRTPGGQRVMFELDPRDGHWRYVPDT